MAINRDQKHAQPDIRVEYLNKQVMFVSQFLVTGSDEELILDMSGGLVSDPDTGKLVLPIQSRVALTPNAARRLISMLERALKQAHPPAPTPELPAAARLPKMRTTPSPENSG